MFQVDHCFYASASSAEKVDHGIYPRRVLSMRVHNGPPCMRHVPLVSNHPFPERGTRPRSFPQGHGAEVLRDTTRVRPRTPVSLSGLSFSRWQAEKSQTAGSLAVAGPIFRTA